MIEIVTDKDRNLKNIKQIGTPREEHKIYIENFAYEKIKESGFKEKAVFVLMGHTERMEGRYATFVEAVIPVNEISFSGNVPRWNNNTWSEVFREIKKNYDELIIVGWAVDIKGMSPKMTVELERVHREHFGGLHQLLFLLDSLEQEEAFYMYKENKLVPKDGFYIYHHARRPVTVVREERPVVNQPRIDVELNIEENRKPVGQYRQFVQAQEKQKKSEGGNLGLAVAVAMLVFVIGVGVYENRESIFGPDRSIETNMLENEDSTEDIISIEEITETED